jgi:hypothetical protein
MTPEERLYTVPWREWHARPCTVVALACLQAVAVASLRPSCSPPHELAWLGAKRKQLISAQQTFLMIDAKH